MEGDTSRDMSNSSALGLSIFLTACTTGWWLYDLYTKSKQTESRLQELEHVVNELSLRQDVHADNLQDQEIRLREKKDYEEEEELEDGIYQAWIGSSKSIPIGLTVRIWREKISTKKKNLEWKSWDNTSDGSCVVRDFYLGNSNPDFSWKVKPFSEETPVSALMEDTLINGWDSICKIEIYLLGSEKNILHFVNKEIFEGSKTCNLALKKCIDDGALVWTRSLIHSN